MTTERAIRRRKKRLTVLVHSEAIEIADWVKSVLEESNRGAVIRAALRLYNFVISERKRGARIQVTNKYAVTHPVELPELGDGAEPFQWRPFDDRARLAITINNKLRQTLESTAEQVGAPSLGYVVTRAILFYRFALEIRRRESQLECVDNRGINGTERVAMIRLPAVRASAWWDCNLFGGFPDCDPRVPPPAEAQGDDVD